MIDSQIEAIGVTNAHTLNKSVFSRHRLSNNMYLTLVSPNGTRLFFI
jgi:hypothetical protein